MAYYRRRYYDKKGKLQVEVVEKCSSGLGQWKASQEQDKRDNIKTRIRTRKTKSGFNKIVEGSYSKFPDGSKMTMRLISNSSKYPKEKSKRRKK